jgi:hypothetical protein
MMPCFSVCRIRPGRRAGGTDVRLDDDSNFQGMGLMGLDFWYLPGELKEGYKQRSGRRKPKPFHLFSTGYTGGGYYRLIGNRAAVRLTAPGPDGALASARIELMGEGFQETAVRCWLERAIVEGKASPALARLYSEVSRHHLFYRYVGANSAAQLHELRMLTDRGDSLYRGYLRLLATAALMQKEAE